MLIARSSLWKVLLSMLVMAIAEAAVFYLRTAEKSVGLEAAFENSFTPYIFALAFIIITMFLCITGSEFGSKTGYTIKRLSITEKSVFYWQWFYNSSVYLMLLAVQIAVSLGLCELYKELIDPQYVTNQTVFLAYYRSEFLHGLLPLGDTTRWIRNAFLIVTLGASSAFFPYRNRRQKQSLEIIAAAIYTFIFFCGGLGEITTDILFCFFSTVILITISAKMHIRWDEDEA